MVGHEIISHQPCGIGSAPRSHRAPPLSGLRRWIFPPTPRGITPNLLESYGILETVAGRGFSNSDTSQWLPSYEGAWATNVCLSRPHISFGDSRGNVLIVDQRSPSVLKVTPDGLLHTYAGTHTAGKMATDRPATNLI